MSDQKNICLPNHLIGGALFGGAVQVVSAPQLVTDDDGKPQVSQHFPGRNAFRARVEWQRGSREKILPDGRKIGVPIFETTAVKIWADSAPKAQEGDYVRLLYPLVGAVEGTTYVQALGLEAVEQQRNG